MKERHKTPNKCGDRGKRGQAQLWWAQKNEIAQLARQPDAKLRRALRASPQFGAGCG
jgi:hypothetical protein